MKLFLPIVLSCFVAAFSVAAADAFKVSEFSFETPAGWRKLPASSSMRAAELKAGEGKDAPDVVFFYFGAGGAGGVKANVDRWLSQFKEPRDGSNTQTEEKTIEGVKVTYVTAQGTYLSGMPGGPKTEVANPMLLGAIVEGKQGSVFVRMTGAASDSKGQTAAFKGMIEKAIK